MSAEKEPAITVNGVPLTNAQAMAVRVAVTNLRCQLTNATFREELGAIGPLYDERLQEVERMMLEGPVPRLGELPTALVRVNLLDVGYIHAGLLQMRRLDSDPTARALWEKLKRASIELGVKWGEEPPPPPEPPR